MGVRVGVLVLLAAVVALGPAADATAGEPTQDLGRARVERDAARSELSGLDARLDTVGRDLDALDDRLDEAAAELARVSGELAAAEAAEHAAADDASAATTALETATRAFHARQDELERREDQLADRVRGLWMHGGSDPGTLLMEGLVRADSLHDASVTLRTVKDLVERDHDLVGAAAAGTRDQARARDTMAAAQRAARDALARATARARQVALLASRQESMTSAITAERDSRAALLASITADRAAAGRLVERLDAEVAALEARLTDALRPADATATLDGPRPPWAAALPGTGQRIAPAIAGAAARVGVDPRLLAALVWTESGFDPRAVSHAGAIGLAQLMPGTAADLGVDPWDPHANLLGGARFLRAQLERFGTADLALAAYNAGPGRVERAGRVVPDIVETRLYVLRVLERFQALAAAG